MTHRASLSPKEQEQLLSRLRSEYLFSSLQREQWAREIFSVCWKTLERAKLGLSLNRPALQKIKRTLRLAQPKTL